MSATNETSAIFTKPVPGTVVPVRTYTDEEKEKINALLEVSRHPHFVYCVLSNQRSSMHGPLDCLKLTLTTPMSQHGLIVQHALNDICEQQSGS